MHYFRGSPALSTFRVEKLLRQIRQNLASIKAIHSEYVHFAEIDGELSEAEQQILDKLLTYGPAFKPEDMAGSCFW